MFVTHRKPGDLVRINNDTKVSVPNLRHDQSIEFDVFSGEDTATHVKMSAQRTGRIEVRLEYIANADALPTHIDVTA